MEALFLLIYFGRTLEAQKESGEFLEKSAKIENKSYCLIVEKSHRNRLSRVMHIYQADVTLDINGCIYV